MIPLLHTKAWRYVSWNVGMPFFIPEQKPASVNYLSLKRAMEETIVFCLPLVLLHIVKIVTADNDGSHHFCTVACASKDTSPNGNIAGEGAFLIYVCP